MLLRGVCVSIHVNVCVNVHVHVHLIYILYLVFMFMFMHLQIFTQLYTTKKLGKIGPMVTCLQDYANLSGQG
jgi:hypothetical protein